MGPRIGAALEKISVPLKYFRLISTLSAQQNTCLHEDEELL